MRGFVKQQGWVYLYVCEWACARQYQQVDGCPEIRQSTFCFHDHAWKWDKGANTLTLQPETDSLNSTHKMNTNANCFV